jgi:hypothetical protein
MQGVNHLTVSLQSIQTGLPYAGHIKFSHTDLYKQLVKRLNTCSHARDPNTQFLPKLGFVYILNNQERDSRGM